MPNPIVPNPMVITLDHFNKMRDHFKKHYFLSNCNVNFGGQETQVPWTSFALVVTNFINTYKVSPDSVAIRFVHCYNVNSKILYQRMQILTMTPDPNLPNIFKLNNTPCAWYILENGTIMPTTIIDLLDIDYLNNFYYCDAAQCSPACLHKLADDQAATQYARTVVMPWGQEVSQLFSDNGSPVNATLCIDACSRLNIIPPSVKFEHGLVIYLRNHEGIPLLDNIEGAAPFYYKAADTGTMCPPQCGVYMMPVL